MPWQDADDQADQEEDDPEVNIPSTVSLAVASEPPAPPHTEDQSTISELLKRRHVSDTNLPSQDSRDIIEINPFSDHEINAP